MHGSTYIVGVECKYSTIGARMGKCDFGGEDEVCVCSGAMIAECERAFVCSCGYIYTCRYVYAWMNAERRVESLSLILVGGVKKIVIIVTLSSKLQVCV